MNDMSPPNPRPQSRALTEFDPVPRLKDRSNGWKPEVQRGFIAALAETGSVAAAAKRVGRAAEGAYLLRRHPEGKSFRKAWEAALKLGVERLEDVAMERALYGVEVPVYHFGAVVGTRRVYNDKLLMFILRNRSPKRFAADSINNADAATRSQLKRLKREWREEWEEEQRAKRVPPMQVRAMIERKVEYARLKVSASQSPVAYAQHKLAHAQRLADEAAGWTPGEPYEEFEAEAARLLPEMVEKVDREWPPTPPPMPEPERGPNDDLFGPYVDVDDGPD